MAEGEPTPQQRRNFYLIILSVVSMQVTASTIYMVFPLFFANAGISRTESGFLISIGTLAGVLSSVVAGVLSNRSGRKTVLLLGTLLYTVVFFLFAYLDHGFGTLMFLRFVEGLGFYVMPVMVTTMAADIFPMKDRGKAMALFSTSGGIGSLIGPLISPYLISGNDYTFYFLFSGGFVLVSAIAMSLFVRETLPESLKKRANVSAIRSVDVVGFLHSVRGLGVVVGVFLVAILIYRTGYTMIDPFFSLYLKDVLRLDLSLTSYIFALRATCTILFSPLAGVLIDKYGRKRSILLGLGMTVITLVGYTFVNGFYPILLLRAWDAVAMALLLTAINTLMADLLSPEMRGFGMGLQSSITQQSSTVGSLFSGFIIDVSGYNAVFYIAAALCFFALIIAQIWVHEPRRETKGKAIAAQPPPTVH